MLERREWLGRGGWVLLLDYFFNFGKRRRKYVFVSSVLALEANLTSDTRGGCLRNPFPYFTDDWLSYIKKQPIFLLVEPLGGRSLSVRLSRESGSGGGDTK